MLTSLFAAGWLQGQDRDQNRDRQQDRIYQHLMLKDGKMYQIQNQEMVQLQEQLRLENGCVVNPDGSYQLKDKKQLKLKNDVTLDQLIRAQEAREKEATNKVSTTTGPKTKRQKLDDLLKQLVEGKISDEDYKAQREKILAEPE